jgi:PmbA protein
LQLADPAYAAATTEKRHALVREMEAACLEAGGDKLVSVTATGQDSRAEYVRLTSNGFTGEQETTNFNGGADATVQDEGDRRPNGYSWASSRRQNGLPAPAEIGREAARRTLALLGAKKIPTATLPIVVENRIAGRLVGELLAPLSGQAIQQKRSCLADKKGQKIGSERLTLIADPLVVGGLGSRLFDGDGMAAKKRTIVEGGVVKDFLVDWYYSRKLGCEPTTGSTGNLILPPGPRSVAELMKALGRGILITDFLGGNSNSTTGDFSVGIMGKLFENGEPVQSVAEMNIADNHLRFWQKLAEAANDPWPYSAMRLPSLVFDGVVVAGK